MMLSGFYQVDFSGPLPGEGGLVVLDAGSVRGGDSQFLYSGTINEVGSSLTATVDVKPIQAGAQNVFGTDGALRLSLTGTANGGSFSLSGTAEGNSGVIAIHGRKISELVF